MEEPRTGGHGAIRYDVAAKDGFDFMKPIGKPWRPTDDQGRELTAEEVEGLVAAIADEAFEERDDPSLDNPRIPAGYTYLGQFIDHDVTRDDRALGDTTSAPTNIRTPRLDLDSVYGGDPKRREEVRDPANPDMLRVGKGFGNEHEIDLPRTRQGDSFDNSKAAIPDKAIIGDSRNDENILVSQVHLSFIQFHNAMVRDGGMDYEQARHKTIVAYQHVVLHDFLRRICGDAFMDRMLGSPKERKFDYPGKRGLFMPLEFSVAAYRFGHSMVRPTYRLNKTLHETVGAPPIPIFTPDDARMPDGNLPLGSLFGGRRLPPLWTLQWDMFVEHKGSRPQMSRRIDTKLAPGLKDLPDFRRMDPEMPKSHRSLPFRNIMRGWFAKLPSGQDLCAAVGIKPISAATTPVNLWQYVLMEAEEQHGGVQLGDLGAHIVAETFIGLTENSTVSILGKERDEVPLARSFPEFLEVAGMPMTADHAAFKVPARSG